MIENIKQYKILGRLGSGGMGDVYKAFDPILEREVAIKVMHPHLLRDENCIRRFLREARAAAKLVHPNVVTIYEVGVGESGSYIVMEFVKGTTLTKLIPKGTGMAPQRALQLGRQLLSALSYAHSNGIVHRDIKTENILVTSEEIVKILDFGIAKLSKERTLTAADSVLGTVEYMSPEQIMGESADRRGDIYAAGVVLYQMLTSRVPFSGDSVVTVVYRQLNEEPIPPSNYNHRVCKELDDIVLKALAKEREKRYSSAKDFQKDLEDHAEHLRIREVSRQLQNQEPAQWEERTVDEDNDGLHPCFVGRERELKRLHQTFSQAVNGKGTTVVVMGEAGIGKTRLAQKLTEFAKLKGAWVLRGDCLYQDGLEPYLPYIDAIRAFFLSNKEELPEEERAKLKEQVRQSIPLLVEYTERFTTSFGFKKSAKSQGSEKGDLFEGIFRLISLMSELRPLVLVIDDLQWADEASLRLFHYLARHVEEAAILLLGICRSDKYDLYPQGKPGMTVDILQRMRNDNLVAEIKLHKLSREEHDQLIDRSLINTEFSEEFYQLIYDETKGNPFFLLETLKNLKDKGLIRKDYGVWHDCENIRIESVPNRIEDIFLRRLQALEEQDRELLQVAAVIGVKFDASIVTNILGIKKIDLLKTLFRLERDFQVVCTAEDSYSFEHPMLRDILYNEIPAELRREYHLLIGEELLRIYGEDLGSYVGEVAQHLKKAGAHAKAIPHLFKAGLRAFKLSAYREASTFFEDTLESLENVPTFQKSPEMIKELYLKLGISYEESGRWDEAIGTLEKLLQVCEEQQDNENKLNALRKMGRIFDKKNDWDKALQVYQQCLDLIKSQGETQMLTALLNNIGIVYFEKGDFRKATKFFQRTLKEGKDKNTIYDKAHALTNLGIIANVQGHYENALNNYNKALKIYQEKRNRKGLARIYHNLGVTYSDKGDWDEAAKAYEKCLQLATDTENKHLRALTLLNLGKVHLRQGNIYEAKGFTKKALKIFKRMKDNLSVAEAFHISGLINSADGNYEDAQKYFEESLKLNQRANYLEGLAETYYSYGNMCQDRGDVERAVELYKRSHHFFQQINATSRMQEVQEALASISAEDQPTCIPNGQRFEDIHVKLVKDVYYTDSKLQ